MLHTNVTILSFGYQNVHTTQLGNARNLPTDYVEDIIDCFFPGTLSAFQTIAPGYHHSLGIHYDRTVMAWGDPGNGRLGNGDSTTVDGLQCYFPVQDTNNVLVGENVTSVSAGYDFSVLLTLDGKVFGFGNTISGQLCQGNITNVTEYWYPVPFVTNGTQMANKFITQISRI
jgi:alpha-tubulin suppressor-like RCC1 family protein